MVVRKGIVIVHVHSSDAYIPYLNCHLSECARVSILPLKSQSCLISSGAVKILPEKSQFENNVKRTIFLDFFSMIVLDRMEGMRIFYLKWERERERESC